MFDEYWKDKRVLITGISGFVGSRLALRLINEGASVIGLSRDPNKVPKFIRDGSRKIYIGDICDNDLLRSIISYEEVSIIYHFAANAIVRTSAKDPVSAYNTNVMGTVSVLEAARIVGGVDKIVVASSDKAYGDHLKLPYKETFALQPKNTYDTSKACMDMISRSYAHNYDMPITVTRCSNIYGPGDMNLSRLIPNTIKLSLVGSPAMLYSDVSVMEREFIYIDDVVEAYEILGYVPHGVCFSSALNIGGNGPEKIENVVNLITKLCRSNLSPEIVDRDPTFKEIGKQYLDADRMKEFGWEPEVTLEEGLKRTVEWYKKFYSDGEYS